MSNPLSIPAVSVTYAQAGTSTRPNPLGMRPMQERAYQKRGEQYLLLKSPPASGKSRALIFIALDKLANQNLKQAIIVVPEKSIGSSFHNEPLTQFGFWADWQVEPQWNLCDAPGGDNGGKVDAVQKFLSSAAKVLVCTHATFRFAVDRFGIEVFDDRLIAVDEFHHVSANPDNKLGDHVRQLMTRDKTHILAMTGSYFRGDAEAGRATRDAPGKSRSRFTNLIAEPDASEAAVTEAVNDTLKAIAASLLMEQVLAPRFEFKAKHPTNQPTPGFDYGENGYNPGKCNVGINPEKALNPYFRSFLVVPDWTWH